MAYDYIKRFYGVTPIRGRRVRHTETGQMGTIMRERASHGHYVRVRFDDTGPGFSHPTSLDYSPEITGGPANG